MLSRLLIRNYAIIDSIEIEFSDQLNVITGETGAGKSILMGALALILGDRADSTILLDKSKKCFIEGYFPLASHTELNDLLVANELETSDELVVRREISPNGKSRAFINDTPVTLDLLRQVTAIVVDLHRQFDTQNVAATGFQLKVVDALAGTGRILKNYRAAFIEWFDCRKELTILHNRKEADSKEFDYNQYLFSELEKANFSEDEIERADQELLMLNNAEAITSVLDKATHILEGSDEAVTTQIKTLSAALRQYGSMNGSLAELSERLAAVNIELKDIASEASHIASRVMYDPRRIALLNERVSEGYRLMKKHNVKSTRELLSIRDELDARIVSRDSAEASIEAMEKKLKDLHALVVAIAAELSDARKKVVPDFELRVNDLLRKVGMPNARIKVAIASREPDIDGSDDIEIQFDANKTGRFESLRKVASGGELSRLMLCIKSLVAESVDLPTMIFDEIDTGISGEAARQVGIIMKQLSSNRQIICITHQPQIAGKAVRHLFVFKQIVNDAIQTNIRTLTYDERITAIAQMLSGEKPTAAALQNAREMVMN
jgi:DNA repair protein RecN (Recombination protein N)